MSEKGGKDVKVLPIFRRDQIIIFEDRIMNNSLCI